MNTTLRRCRRSSLKKIAWVIFGWVFVSLFVTGGNLAAAFMVLVVLAPFVVVGAAIGIVLSNRT